MIKFRIQEVARKRGITTAYQLQKAMDVPPGTAARLWNRAEGITFKTLDAICTALECKPGELFDWEPTSEAKKKR